MQEAQPAFAAPASAPVRFRDLAAFEADDAQESWSVLTVSCEAILAAKPCLREAVTPPLSLVALCAQIVRAPAPRSQGEALDLWARHFEPWRLPGGERGAGFLTGYYEPIVDGSLLQTTEFPEPVYGLPADLVAIPFDQRNGRVAAGRLGNGGIEPYPDRAAIDAGTLKELAKPVCWLRDGIEAFMIQVQGSARVRLQNGQILRLVYAGRNGLPYTSIGRILIGEGHIAEAEMSLERLKHWVRTAGQGPGEAGRRLMQRNQSYVFFAVGPDVPETQGPIGGQGLALTPLRSIAIDRSLWPYGLPFWIEADLPWKGTAPSPFRRLMIAQDTGSAIVGLGRIDVFFGSGEAAGGRAGDIRHPANVTVLLPKRGFGAGAT